MDSPMLVFTFAEFVEKLRAFEGASFFMKGIKIAFSVDGTKAFVYLKGAKICKPRIEIARPYVKQGGLSGLIMTGDLGKTKVSAILEAMRPAAERQKEGFKAWLLSWERQGVSALYVSQSDGVQGWISLVGLTDVDVMFDDNLVPKATGHLINRPDDEPEFVERYLERR